MNHRKGTNLGRREADDNIMQRERPKEPRRGRPSPNLVLTKNRSAAASRSRQIANVTKKKILKVRTPLPPPPSCWSSDQSSRHDPFSHIDPSQIIILHRTTWHDYCLLIIKYEKIRMEIIVYLFRGPQILLFIGGIKRIKMYLDGAK